MRHSIEQLTQLTNRENRFIERIKSRAEITSLGEKAKETIEILEKKIDCLQNKSHSAEKSVVAEDILDLLEQLDIVEDMIKATVKAISDQKERAEDIRRNNYVTRPN